VSPSVAARRRGHRGIVVLRGVVAVLAAEDVVDLVVDLGVGGDPDEANVPVDPAGSDAPFLTALDIPPFAYS